MFKLNPAKAVILDNKLKNYLFRNYQCLSRYPRLFIMRKLARFNFVRQISRYFPFKINQSPQITLSSPSLFKGLNVTRIVTCLKTEGCFLGLQLPENIVRELLYFAAHNYCYGDRNLEQPLLIESNSQIEKKIPQKYRRASYLDIHHNCDAFQRLINDRILLEIARQYFQKPAVYLTSELYWSFPHQSSHSQMVQDAQVFHYDIDDYQSLKFFFYLTDVDLFSGAHVCILKSHKNKRFWHQLIGQHSASILDSKLIEVYGRENVLEICGKEGFGFVEDTFCFHKATTPTQKSRLLLQLEFATNYYQEPRAYMR